MNDLLAQITARMGSLVAVADENCGQLDALKNGETAYGVAFPCVLVGIPETTWTGLKSGIWRGQASVSLQLAFDCGAQQGAHSPQASSMAQRLQLWQALNEVVEGWRFDGCQTVAVRSQSLQYALPGNIKVYEHLYTTTLAENGSEEA